MYSDIEREKSKEEAKTTAPLSSESLAARQNQTRKKLAEVSPFSSGYSEVSPFSSGYTDISPFSSAYRDKDTSPLQMKAKDDFRGPSSPFARSGGNPYAGTPLSVSGNLAESIQESFGIDTNELALRESPEVADMGARATAQGDVIRFAPGEFNPDTHEGLSVLGHELAHVRDQADGSVRANVEGTNIHYDAGHEAASDRAGEAFASGAMAGGVGAVSLAGAGGMGVECEVLDELPQDMNSKELENAQALTTDGELADRDSPEAIERVAKEVIRGEWKNWPERENLLKEAGYNYNVVQARVEQIIEEVAREVIRGNKWDVWPRRKELLDNAGYKYEVIQARVNQIMVEMNPQRASARQPEQQKWSPTAINVQTDPNFQIPNAITSDQTSVMSETGHAKTDDTDQIILHVTTPASTSNQFVEEMELVEDLANEFNDIFIIDPPIYKYGISERGRGDYLLVILGRDRYIGTFYYSGHVYAGGGRLKKVAENRDGKLYIHRADFYEAMGIEYDSHSTIKTVTKEGNTIISWVVGGVVGAIGAGEGLLDAFITTILGERIASSLTNEPGDYKYILTVAYIQTDPDTRPEIYDAICRVTVYYKSPRYDHFASSPVYSFVRCYCSIERDFFK